MSQGTIPLSVKPDSLDMKDDFFRELPKHKLLIIGFTENQYTEFMDDTEQLCGQFHSDITSIGGPKNHRVQSKLYDLAQIHLSKRWSSIVQAGVQGRQQARFWDGWLSSCLREVTRRKSINKWYQTKLFDDQSQADQNLNDTFLNAPTIATGASTSTRSTFTTANPALTTTESDKMKNQVLPQIVSGDKTSLVSISWRDVVLRVSFQRLPTSTEKIRPMKVPLIRCVDTQHQGLDEDSSVTATWLDFKILQSLVTKHLSINRQNITLANTTELILCACFDTCQVAVTLDCSNDFHIAYNKWIRQRDILDNDFWLIAIPHSIFSRDSDSDIPDAMNPFGRSKRLKLSKRTI